MDDFSLDRQELNGTLISMEFGPGGRIQQLWASDPNAPDENEEFQFIAPPMAMGEEITDDYFPGTLLIGARTHPEDPWMLARNVAARPIEEDDDGRSIGFEYELGLLDDLRATGRFYEIPGAVPQIAWDISLTNRSRRGVEIGELGFPLAMNNVLEGFPLNDHGIREMWNDRVHVHKFIGGAASYVHAQRMTGRPPGLLIFPGHETRWEFYHHVAASLATPLRWEGIPVVYVHSLATIEREGWGEWFNGHTRDFLEPGEERRYQIRFAPVDRQGADQVAGTLSACGRPSIRLFPGAIAPAGVGIGIEVGGTTPTRFETDVEMELETDSDEEGGFCYVRPPDAGAVRVLFEDTQGRLSETHLLFTEAISSLIEARADWIVGHQIAKDNGVLRNAIVPADNGTGLPITDPDAYGTPFGVESSLADALFLAEKNAHVPHQGQIEILDRYLSDFLEDDVRNPSDGSVGCLLPDLKSVAANYGRPAVYPLTFCLYQSMARVAASYGGTRRTAAEYLQLAAQSAEAMFEHAHLSTMRAAGVSLMSHLPSLLDDLRANGLSEPAARIDAKMRIRHKELSRRRYPFTAESAWTTSGFEEAALAARSVQHEELEERTLRCALAGRSLSPSWWWYASDKRWPDDTEVTSATFADKGELCLGGSTVTNSLLFMPLLGRDYAHLPEAAVRLAFGGLLGLWALVRADGAGASGFCPDLASRHFGISPVTGDLGVGLFSYLRGVASYVLPSAGGVTTFGCHFEVDNEGGTETLVVRPWDGVGRRVVVRQLGVEAETSFGRITEVRFDSRKRKAVVTIENPSDKDQNADLRVTGLWGSRYAVDGKELQGEQSGLKVNLVLPASASSRIAIAVIG